MGKNDDIERLFREQFEGYRITPSKGLWGRVVRRLRWREFLHFSPGQFNVWYVAGALTVATVAWLALHDRKAAPENSPVVPVTVTQQATHTSVVSGEREPGKAAVTQTSRSAAQKVRSASRPQSQDGSRKESTAADVPQEKLSPPVAGKAGGKDAGKVSPQKTAPAPEKEKVQVSLSQEKEKPAPVARFAASSDKGCPPLTVHFANLSKYASSFLWKITPGNIVITEASPEYVFQDPGQYIISLTARDEEGRTAVHTDTIQVFARPQVRFDYSPKDAVIPDDEVYFFNNTLDGEQYLWSFGDGHTSAEPDPVHRYTTDGPFDVKLTAWSENGCVDSMVLRGLFKNNSYYIRFPNAFIANPNGPGGGYYTPGSLSNDVFHPVWKGVASYHLQIFNRRGELVFESEDLKRGWDGYILDQLATPGVYIWKARGTFSNGKPFVRFGNVTLIKKK